jgi:hypothetical protein
MQKPNAIFHMMRYGFVYGFVLAMLYIWICRAMVSASNIEEPSVFGSMLAFAFISFSLGALPGAFFGLIDGFVLNLLVSQVHISVDARRILSYLVLGALTLAGMSFLTLSFAPIFSSPDFTLFGTQRNGLWFSLPIPIAMFASIYAVHRYFLKLSAWGSVGKAKNKEKHGLKNQLAYEDAAEAKNYLVDKGVNQQQKNG